ncbi:MAG: ATP-binding cassette domain-containing protein [Pseudomonadales bacterium]|nr:ATP-binding cassette domain-containing protein [Pseudomonadales bacterium]
MIHLSEVALLRGNKTLLSDASFTAHAGWHIGLTGRNGCGKSSLFALLKGELSADQGEYNIPRDWQIAHMEQEIDALDKSAIDYVIDGDSELRRLQKALSKAEATEDNHQIAHLHHELDLIDAYRAETKAAKLLIGLGFQQNQLNTNVRDFSGGWRMRLNLAKTLMCRSDLLLLDEPTNHLDLDAIIWLESWIQQYQGTAIIISHDRDFLDKTVQHILHIEHQTLNHYKGNYTQFEITRAEQLALQQAQFEKQQRQIAHMQSFIDRFRAKATKAKQAQSRIKALERLEQIAPAHVDSPFQFSFREPEKMPNPLMRVDKGCAGYGENARIIENIDLHIGPESRIGLLGPNGAGKSTLIKSIAGELPLIAGSREVSEHLNIGYFAQHQLDQLDPEATPLISMRRIAPNAEEPKIRSYLGSFGFSGDMVDHSIGHFSGGEKSRLALALIIWHKPNLLLLDEPTNHLDLEMRHALTLALQTYQGGLILVSHDRHLIRNTTDELLLVANGKIETFKEDLDAYANWLSEHRQQELKFDSQNGSSSTPKVDKKVERQKAAELRNQLRPLKKECDGLETKLDKLQTTKASLDEQLADNSLYEEQHKTKLSDLLQKQAETQQAINETEEAWMLALEALEALEAELSE